MVGCAFFFAGALAAIGAALPATPSAGGATMPRCLGKEATIVGQGGIRGTAHADVIVAGSAPTASSLAVATIASVRPAATM